MAPIDPADIRLPRTLPQTLPRASVAGEIIRLEQRLTGASLALGQEVIARVISDRASGRFIASLGGRQVEIELPRSVQAGDSVRLVVVAEQPRLLLVPQQAPQNGTLAAGARPALVATVSAPLPTVDGTGAGAGAAGDEVSVSAEGRALTRLIGDLSTLVAREAAGSSGRAGAGAAGVGPQAVTSQLAAPLAALVQKPADHPVTLAAQLAGALAKTLSASGLFYESHQAQWVAGERSLESLKAEPQGRLVPLVPLPARAAGESAPAGPAMLAGARATAAAAEPMPRNPTASARDLQSSGMASSLGVLESILDLGAAPLVQQQLSALDSRMATWSGQVLPGMHAQMTVHERPGEGQPQDADAAATDWATRLVVTLPRLGAIEAQLTLRADRLVLSVATVEADAAAELGSAREALAQALADAGLQVDGFQVNQR